MSREEIIERINEYLDLLPDQSVKVVMELLEVYPEIKKEHSSF